MKKPSVSVVIPAYNHEKFVGPAVESVLNQTFQDFELIVVDDGSTDRTGEVVKSYTDKRIQYIFQENQDAFNTINRGLNMAQGEFVAILNSDDIYHPNRLEKLLAEQSSSKAACIFTDVQPVSAEGKNFEDPDFGWNQWHKKNRDFYFECKDLYTAFLKGNFMVTTSNLFLTNEAVKKVGDFCSLRYLHDYDYIFRVMLAYPDGVKYLDGEKLLQYRIHGGNTLSEAAITGREQDQDVIRKYMLKKVTDDIVPLVNAGVDRLVELEHELQEVKAMLGDGPDISIRKQIKALLGNISKKIRR